MHKGENNIWNKYLQGWNYNSLFAEISLHSLFLKDFPLLLKQKVELFF